MIGHREKKDNYQELDIAISPINPFIRTPIGNFWGAMQQTVQSLRSITRDVFFF